MIQGREPDDHPDDHLDERWNERPEPGLIWPFELMAICLVAVGMAILIGVIAGLVWLRVFGSA